MQQKQRNIKSNNAIVVLSDYGSEDITILGNGRAFISAVSIGVEELPNVGLNKHLIERKHSEKVFTIMARASSTNNYNNN